MTRLMVAFDRNEIPHRFEVEDDERVRLTKAGNLRVMRDGQSFTEPMETPAVVVYELVEECRA